VNTACPVRRASPSRATSLCTMTGACSRAQTRPDSNTALGWMPPAALLPAGNAGSASPSARSNWRSRNCSRKPTWPCP